MLNLDLDSKDEESRKVKKHVLFVSSYIFVGRTHLQNLYNKALDVCGAAVEDVMLNISLLPERTADSGIKKL